jgi:uncharacterized membrane protein YhaH (DUF805 family)
MKWIQFFSRFDGRIGRKTFWLMSIAIIAIELLVIFVAVSIVPALGVDDRWIELIVFAFIYPKFVIDVKRGHDRNIPLGVIGGIYAAAIVRQVFVDFGWLATDPNQNVFSTVNVASFAITLILGIACLALLVELGFRKGTPGPNCYGPDPFEPQTLPLRS